MPQSHCSCRSITSRVWNPVRVRPRMAPAMGMGIRPLRLFIRASTAIVFCHLLCKGQMRLLRDGGGLDPCLLHSPLCFYYLIRLDYLGVRGRFLCLCMFLMPKQLREYVFELSSFVLSFFRLLLPLSQSVSHDPAVISLSNLIPYRVHTSLASILFVKYTEYIHTYIVQFI